VTPVNGDIMFGGKTEVVDVTPATAPTTGHRETPQKGNNMWFIQEGKVTLHNARIRGTESEFRAWLDENWILAPGTEVTFNEKGRLVIVWTISEEAGSDELGYFNYTDDEYMSPIIEIPATRRDADFENDQWNFLAVGWPKAHMENLLSAIGKEWLTAGADITWEGIDYNEDAETDEEYEFAVTGWGTVYPNGDIAFTDEEIPDIYTN